MVSPSSLSGVQARHLRALAHPLKPIVQLGKHGWTDAVSKQIDQALLDHELIKVKLGSEAPLEKEDFLRTVVDTLGASVAQTIGSIVVLYRRHPQKPKIQLPRPRGGAKNPTD